MSKYHYNGLKKWMKYFYKIIAVTHPFPGNILGVQLDLCVIILVKLWECQRLYKFTFILEILLFGRKNWKLHNIKFYIL